MTGRLSIKAALCGIVMLLSACGAQTPRGTATPAFNSAIPAVIASVATVRPTGTVQPAAAVEPSPTLAPPATLPNTSEPPTVEARAATSTIEPEAQAAPATSMPAAPMPTTQPRESISALQSPLTPPGISATVSVTSMQSTPISGTPQITATLPIVQNGSKRVLFINGDHTPETGYPHSRVSDDGSKPESFSQLRKRVLEGKLALGVDEFVLTATNTISSELITAYTAIVLGSNARVLTPGETAALLGYANTGGRILIYADFQYGPTNWASDNAFLAQLGIEVFPDNFQPTTQITDVVASHPIMAGVQSFGTEGSSQFLIPVAAQSKITVLTKCSPLERPGCALQAPELAKVKAGDVVACTWIQEFPAVNGKAGRIAGTCDRNTFHNGPGIGTALGELSNEIYATNLFRWLTE